MDSPTLTLCAVWRTRGTDRVPRSVLSRVRGLASFSAGPGSRVQVRRYHGLLVNQCFSQTTRLVAALNTRGNVVERSVPVSIVTSSIRMMIIMMNIAIISSATIPEMRDHLGRTSFTPRISRSRWRRPSPSAWSSCPVSVWDYLESSNPSKDTVSA